MKKYLIGILIGVLCVCGIAYVIADTLIASSQVSYTESKSVEAALDELIDSAKTHCPDGFICKDTLYSITAKRSRGIIDPEKYKTVSGCSEDTDECKNGTDDPSGTTGVWEYDEKLGANSDGGSMPIYYYRGPVRNNNVIFADYCWLIVRTTSTGGTKMIYNGTPNEDGECDGTGAVLIGSLFNYYTDDTKAYYYSFYKYDENNYRGTSTDSGAKIYLEQTWYTTSNLNNEKYENIMEDTPYCMDRNPLKKVDNIMQSATPEISDEMYCRGYCLVMPCTSKYVSDFLTLSCNEDDLLSVTNGELNKKIALITLDEATLAGYSTGKYTFNIYLNSEAFYTMTPTSYVNDYGYGLAPRIGTAGTVDNVYPRVGHWGSKNNKIRPVISIQNGTEVVSGDGTSTSPYQLLVPEV